MVVQRGSLCYLLKYFQNIFPFFSLVTSHSVRNHPLLSLSLEKWKMDIEKFFKDLRLFLCRDAFSFVISRRFGTVCCLHSPYCTLHCIGYRSTTQLHLCSYSTVRRSLFSARNMRLAFLSVRSAFTLMANINAIHATVSPGAQDEVCSAPNVSEMGLLAQVDVID